MRLQAARYVGGLTISPNKVTLIGAGAGRTVIEGNLTITGNNCVLRNLTVTGSVIIRANNADLRGAQIGGQVISQGNNNVW